MAIIVRIDVDRAYGKSSLLKQFCSRIASDYYFPRIQSFGYLEDLAVILNILETHNARAYVFFRQCTLPSKNIQKRLQQNGHIAGLHLENSRSFQTFSAELNSLKAYLGQDVISFSKHGSGVFTYGRYHYAPYEPEKYVDWGQRSDMRVFMGNGEDPTQNDYMEAGLHVYPSAYWLEPHWRNTTRYNFAWLAEECQNRDVVLLLHADNVTADPKIMVEFREILENLPTTVVQGD